MGIFHSAMSRENSFDEDEMINNNELKSNIEENPVELKEVEQIEEDSSNVSDDKEEKKEGLLARILGSFMIKSNASDTEEEKEKEEEEEKEKEEA
mgnify:CR=1 FL=1|tara:strand:- start:4409 stop:4693 length:285 start_codon:yes stop_codon:yes gene_type:complete